MRIVLGILLSLFISIGFAEETSEPLLPDNAFAFSIYLTQKDQIMLKWVIAKDYYIYRDQVIIAKGPKNNVKLGDFSLPEGRPKQDSIRGQFQAYFGTLVIPISVSSGILDLTVRYQGCSAKGFCYVPIKKHLTVNTANIREFPTDLTPQLNGVVATTDAKVSDEQYAEKIFDGHNIFIIILSFLGLGLLLSFTPCVLPMIPILSGIIMGHRRKLNTLKTFFLSLSYVLGMAITYMIAGIVVASLGSRVQTFLQTPLVIFLFSGIFVLLALSLFGVYELQLPASWQQRLTTLSHRQKGGTYIGVFFMGSISSLIVSPCVSAPLVGVLAYIAQTGNMVLGGTALLALGFGMGIPLLLLGASAGRLLPKAGHWMVTIERLMGIAMLAFAIWIISRIMPGHLVLFLWAIFFIGLAVFMGLFSRALSDKDRLRRGFGIVLFIYGIILMIGAFLGNSDLIHPWENWLKTTEQNHQSLVYINIKEMSQLETALHLAKEEHKPVMLDFYADWCQSCVNMERHLFKEQKIQAALSDFVLLRADVTENNRFDRLLLKRFKVIAPPTFVFFNTAGIELTSKQIVGEKNAEEFLSHLTQIRESSSANE